MKLAVLTPTGDRPQAFALAERYMLAQTLQPDLWFVTDDGATPIDGTLGQSMIRLPQWTQSGTSQHRNMIELLAAAERSDADAFVIWEDDDRYAPAYLERCAELLQQYELIGETPARYYNVKTRHWRTFRNDTHASLCQTAFRRSMIQPMREVVATGQWIDMAFWPRYLSRGHLWEGYNVLGIKGMPGRAGISNAHRETESWGHYDADLSKLREWIGNDADLYAEYFPFTAIGDTKRINGPTVWCSACGFATVERDGDVCSVCSQGYAHQLQTFEFRGRVQYRCPEWPRCGFDSSVVETVMKHHAGCVERKGTEPGMGGVFDA